ncbi:methyltransferase domain-containing protein [Catellatospora sp. KI3]|uniref:class I SAM-dependent methyltransferase n=1 Tax=Catellatospora sp. KI3 TaxID=3041620 RepID=UPI0024825586|nr:methyltransferase domain-containing protein [Catellatospora sp. KI3]MDI1461120.1 methyltransferase domain-containing protein [Catellatospora sp. KI3]
MGVIHKPLELLEDNFKKPTGFYGRLVGHLMTVQHRTLTDWTIDQMGIADGDDILDIGCGSGMALGLMAARDTTGTLAGIDYSPVMVDLAAKRNAAAVRAGRMTIQHGDAMNLPFEQASFDHVTAIETFYFWPDAMRGLKQAHRVLRPGGQMIVTLEMSREASGRPSLVQRYFGRRFTERSAREGLRIVSGADLTGMLTEAGFTGARFVAEPTRSLGWVCALARKP